MYFGKIWENEVNLCGGLKDLELVIDQFVSKQYNHLLIGAEKCLNELAHLMRNLFAFWHNMHVCI